MLVYVTMDNKKVCTCTCMYYKPVLVQQCVMLHAGIQLYCTCFSLVVGNDSVYCGLD